MCQVCVVCMSCWWYPHCLCHYVYSSSWVCPFGLHYSKMFHVTCRSDSYYCWCECASVYTPPLSFLSYTNENYCSLASTADLAPLSPKHYQSQTPVFTGQDFSSHLFFFYSNQSLPKGLFWVFFVRTEHSMFWYSVSNCENREGTVELAQFCCFLFL